MEGAKEGLKRPERKGNEGATGERKVHGEGRGRRGNNGTMGEEGIRSGWGEGKGHEVICT